MKKLTSLAIAAFLACGVAKADPATQEYAKHANEFGAKVFQNIYKNGKQGENILYSPVSMHYALSMVGHFGDASAQKSLFGAFGLQSLSSSQLGESARRLLTAFKSAGTGRYKINLSNGFWLTKGFAPSGGAAVSALKKDYMADFSNDLAFSDPAAADTINSWVAKATDEKIKNLVSAKELAPLQWASVSAIYFEGKWFEKLGGGKHSSDFNKPDGGKASATYMEASPGMGVFSMEQDDVNVYEVAYGEAKNGKPVSEPGALVILQPKNPKTFSKLVEKLNGQYIESVLTGIEQKKSLGKSPYIALHFPAFELSFETGMEPVKDVLVRNGGDALFSAFDMSALNPLLTVEKQNKIKLIKQKATITMANVGTTAAAASFVGGGIESMGPRSVYVNSAFVYLIVDRATRSVLFQGSFVDPDKATVPEMK